MTCAPTEIVEGSAEPFVTGPWCGWCVEEGFNVLQDTDGDGVYTVSIDGLEGEVEYRYAADGFDYIEDLLNDVWTGGECAPITDGSTYANRVTTAGSSTFDTYGTCNGVCNDGPIQTNITLHTGGIGATDTATVMTLELRDGGDEWVSYPLDAMVNSNWSCTAELLPGGFEWRVTANGYNTYGHPVFEGFFEGNSSEIELCFGQEECQEDADSNGIQDFMELMGCTDESACNYNVLANVDDGSCQSNDTGDECFEESGLVEVVFQVDAAFNALTNNLVGMTYWSDLSSVFVTGNLIDNWASANTSGYDERGKLSDDDGDSVYVGSFWIPEGVLDYQFAIELNAGDQWRSFITTNIERDGIQVMEPGPIILPVTGLTYTGDACSDTLACNYNPELWWVDEAYQQDEIVVGCVYDEAPFDCYGNCLNDSDEDGVCDELEVAGCTEPVAFNFDPFATEEDGSCQSLGPNCSLTDEAWQELNALEFLPQQGTEMLLGELDTLDQIALVLPSIIAEPATGVSYLAQSFTVDSVTGVPEGLELLQAPESLVAGQATCVKLAGIPTEVGPYWLDVYGTLTILLFGQPYTINNSVVSHLIQVLPNPNPIPGCTYPWGGNFLPFATVDDGSCIVTGCTDSDACNHQPLANADDGSCDYSCLGCTYDQALNFNPEATRDDGTCHFQNPVSPCPADLDGSGNVGSGDLLMLLAAYGEECLNP
ncbi:MAG: hypothetical protein ACPF87_02055 [Flavobacteriales bacterium]